jgi:4-hydroxybenzoate polyprenyltransferase
LALTAEPEIFWTRIFMATCYAAAAVCLYRAMREGYRTSFKCALAQVLVFTGFAGAFWFVESWAHHRTGFYLYSATFSDALPRIRFDALVPAGVVNECTKLVGALGPKLQTQGIPLCIVLMEASLTYSAMWTARLLGANLAVQPLVAALLMLDIDLLLDPVLATAHECSTGAPLASSGFGLGLWRWYADPASTEAAQFFGIPIFNYAAWFAAPLLLVSFTNLLGPFVKGWLIPRWRRQLDEDAPAGWEGLTLLVMVIAIACMFAITPDKLSRAAQWGLLGGGVMFALAFVLKCRSRYEYGHSHDPTLTFSVIVAFLVPVVALFSRGVFVEAPWLLPVGIFSIGFGLFLIWQPYRDAMRSFCERLKDGDRFVRLHSLGFRWMLVLLGAATVRPDPDARLMLGLLLVAVCFHIHGYVLNDVIDLDVDRTQARRRQDPLVRGAISKEAAFAFALVQIPLAALIGFHMQLGTWAWCALGAGFALSVVYDKWGKLCPVPPLTDLVQGLAWGSLVLFGIFAATPEASYLDVRERALPLLAYGVGFIFLINGVHGGLRDLSTDLRCRRRTTAIFLGGLPSWEGPEVSAESSWRVVSFAFGVHTAMFAPSFEFLWRDVGHYDGGWRGAAWAGIGGLFFISSYLLWRVVKPLERRRGQWISAHIFVLLLAPLALYVTSNVTSEVFKIVVLACFFVPLALQQRALDLMIGFIERRRAAAKAAARDRDARLPASVPEPGPGGWPQGPPPPAQ